MATPSTTPAVQHGHGQTSTRPQSTTDAVLPQFLRDLARAERRHGDRCKRYDTFDDIYNGKLDNRNPRFSASAPDADGDWRSDLHPPYAFETIQTELAMLLDNKPIAAVKPPEGKVDPKSKAQAKAYEQKLDEQRRRDDYQAKMTDNYQCGLVYGISVVKHGWAYDHATIKQQDITPIFGALPERVMVDRPQTILNQPTITVCNPRDVMWNPEAQSARDITTFFYRTYETKASLLALQEDGVYSDVDMVAGAGGQGGMESRPGARDVKDDVEVWERWQLRTDGVWLTTVANRNVVIRDEASPYLLGGKTLPFSVVTPTPQPFHVEGKSECELIGEQQVARWRVENQMMDAGEMILDPPIFAKDNIEDPDEIEWRTGKLNLMPATGGPLSEQLYFPAMPTALLTAGSQLLELLQSDMESVTGVSSYLSGAETNAVDAKTATEVQAISSSGQRRILMKKQRFADQEREIGTFQLQLNEQLAPDVIPAYGPNGEPMPLRIQDIIGCQYEVEDADESLNRQERRTEAALVLQTIGALAAVPPIAMSVNWRWLLENYFEANDIDPEQALAAEQMQPPGIPGAPQLPGGLASPNGGGGVPPGIPPTPPQGAGSPGVLPFARPGA